MNICALPLFLLVLACFPMLLRAMNPPYNTRSKVNGQAVPGRRYSPRLLANSSEKKETIEKVLERKSKLGQNDQSVKQSNTGDSSRRSTMTAPNEQPNQQGHAREERHDGLISEEGHNNMISQQRHDGLLKLAEACAALEAMMPADSAGASQNTGEENCVTNNAKILDAQNVGSVIETAFAEIDQSADQSTQHQSPMKKRKWPKIKENDKNSKEKSNKTDNEPMPKGVVNEIRAHYDAGSNNPQETHKQIEWTDPKRHLEQQMDQIEEQANNFEASNVVHDQQIQKATVKSEVEPVASEDNRQTKPSQSNKTVQWYPKSDQLRNDQNRRSPIQVIDLDDDEEMEDIADQQMTDQMPKATHNFAAYLGDGATIEPNNIYFLSSDSEDDQSLTPQRVKENHQIGSKGKEVAQDLDVQMTDAIIPFNFDDDLLPLLSETLSFGHDQHELLPHIDKQLKEKQQQPQVAPTKSVGAIQKSNRLKLEVSDDFRNANSSKPNVKIETLETNKQPQQPKAASKPKSDKTVGTLSLGWQHNANVPQSDNMETTNSNRQPNQNVIMPESEKVNKPSPNKTVPKADKMLVTASNEREKFKKPGKMITPPKPKLQHNNTVANLEKAGPSNKEQSAKGMPSKVPNSNQRAQNGNSMPLSCSDDFAMVKTTAIIHRPSNTKQRCSAKDIEEAVGMACTESIRAIGQSAMEFGFMSNQIFALTFKVNVGKLVEEINKTKDKMGFSARSVYDHLRKFNNWLITQILDELWPEIGIFGEKIEQDLKQGNVKRHNILNEMHFVFFYARLYRKLSKIIKWTGQSDRTKSTATLADQSPVNECIDDYLEWFHTLNIGLTEKMTETLKENNYLITANFVEELDQMEEAIQLTNLGILFILPQDTWNIFEAERPTTVADLYEKIGQQKIFNQFEDNVEVSDDINSIEETMIKKLALISKIGNDFVNGKLTELVNAMLVQLKQCNSATGNLKNLPNKIVLFLGIVHQIRDKLQSSDGTTNHSMQKLSNEKANGIEFLTKCINVLSADFELFEKGIRKEFGNLDNLRKGHLQCATSNAIIVAPETDKT